MIIVKENYLSIIDVEYDGIYNCERMGCDEEGICRCYTITEIKNIKLNIRTFGRYLYESYKKQDYYERSNKIMKILSDIDSDYQENMHLLGINYILSNNKIWELKNWDVKVGSIYYGEEVQGAYPTAEIVDKINMEFKEFLSMRTLKEKTNYLYPLTSSYNDNNYSIELVGISDVIFNRVDPCDS